MKLVISGGKSIPLSKHRGSHVYIHTIVWVNMESTQTNMALTDSLLCAILVSEQIQEHKGAVVSKVRDFFWVLQAYLRGKVLRQKAYLPQPWGTMSSFQWVSGMTVSRAITLAKWWGCRPATFQEVNRLLRDTDSIPYLRWNGSEVEMEYDPDHRSESLVSRII